MERELKIPEGFEVLIENKKIIVRHNGKSLEKQLNYPSNIQVRVENGKLIASSDSDRRKIKAMLGTIIAHTRNLIKGLKDGYTYKLKVVYTHFPISVKVEGDEVVISNFLGEKTLRRAKILGDTKVQINGQEITVSGINKELVGQTAANIENATRISKKDRRVFQDGIYIVKSRD
ncbi:MAG: 50S ribosomal protein L6 [Candidatus Aenigmarchaeota archaeon]|nr:50S ribosomal protein L6 [Candidatus Aenigmarchaeota archaeon]MBU5688972.1 50S ribosomal protein L6 [Candidatus Aenigmarchaeota archaeon]